MNDFDKACADVWRALGGGGPMVLSTAADSIVTSRTMSVVVLDGRFYFQTDTTFRKCEQLRRNPRAALCHNDVQIEGVCEELGRPLAHPAFCEIYRARFASSFQRYSALPDERLFVLTPTRMQRWSYENDLPYEEFWDFERHAYEKRAYLPRNMD